jgi:hypothetical protein
MPIAYVPGSGGPTPGGVTDSLLVKPPNAVMDPAPPTPFMIGHAVYLGDDGGGTPTVYLCGATPVDRPDLFMGFLDSPGLTPGATLIASGRGSRVVPMVEGGGTLTPNVEVWLAVTPGEVTQTAPSGSGATILKVGVATSTTEIVLTTDFRQVIP